ncbi:PAS domain-containing sensor histidine kinase [Uliginosibacterium sp. 31-16]|uniref:PAS domain-containing sensor histidine kinase n=1 Tax=Uliginosibacterium sp. 31-16 TaxID=3068315 RepID=UPI00273F9293|nr:PAS domain-containing sensor histidine kinase [Uliginosibacterium sp. 31-16]MDP5238591.1 PAS domain-containing sensor histidine kinase [Uliginosibacterium sp. 31-16]
MPEPIPTDAAPLAAAMPGADAALIDADLRLIRIVLCLFIGLGFPLSLAGNLAADTPALQIGLFPAAILSIGFGALWLLQRQQVKLAMALFLWGLVVLVGLKCLLVNGIRSPIATTLPLIVILCAWVTSTRHTLILCSVLLVTLSGMALLDQHFWATQLPRSPFQYWVVYSFCIVVGGVVAAYLAAAMRRQHARQEHAGGELAMRLQELRLEREKFSIFFYLNPVPVSITLLADGAYFDVNPAWEKLSGWSKDEVAGKTATQIGIWVTPAERDAWVAEFRQSGRTSNQLVRFRLRDGSIRHFVANCETILFDGHKCIFAAFVDVTARREAEEALKQLNARLEERVAERTQRLAEANQSLANTVDILQRTQDELVHSETMASLGSMVAGVSHELNTPIGNALTVVSSLQERAREMSLNFDGETITRSALQNFIAEQEQGASLASSSLQRASELVASFKQVAVDQTSERRRPFDLAETLDSVINTLRPMLRFKPIKLICDLPAGIRMDSYPGPLGQIISNLVQNAVLHGLADTAGGTVQVHACELDADSLQIVVRDDGQGIRDEHLGRIFDPFFTTRLGQGGSGLGLAIVYRLTTTLLGGSISVDSQPGQGACFTLTLPKVAPDGAVQPV